MAYGYPPFRVEIVKVDGGYRYRLWDADNFSHGLSRRFDTEADCLSAADLRRAALGGTAVYAGDYNPPLRIEIIRAERGYRYRLWDADNLSHDSSRVFQTEADCLGAADLRRAAMHGTAPHAAFDAPRFRIEIVKVDGGFRYRLWDADNLPHHPSPVFETEAECRRAARQRGAAMDPNATYAGDDDPSFRIEIVKVDGGFRYRLWDADNLPHGPSRVFVTEADCRRAARQRRAALEGAAGNAGDDDQDL